MPIQSCILPFGRRPTSGCGLALPPLSPPTRSWYHANDDGPQHYFMRLALGGQARLRKGDHRGAIPFFEAALKEKGERVGDGWPAYTGHG